MTELASVKKGEGQLELKIEDGKVKLVVSYDGQQADAKLEVALSVEEYLDMLKDAIPGDIDDTIIDLIKVAMK